MTALLILGAVLIILILIGASRRADRMPAPRLLSSRRPAPADPMIDPAIDPLVAPWAVPLSNPQGEALLNAEHPDNDDDFAPGGGNFGGGGANGSWDGADDDTQA